jgi:hypothetical protein
MIAQMAVFGPWRLLLSARMDVEQREHAVVQLVKRDAEQIGGFVSLVWPLELTTSRRATTCLMLWLVEFACARATQVQNGSEQGPNGSLLVLGKVQNLERVRNVLEVLGEGLVGERFQVLEEQVVVLVGLTAEHAVYVQLALEQLRGAKEQIVEDQVVGLAVGLVDKTRLIQRDQLQQERGQLA